MPSQNTANASNASSEISPVHPKAGLTPEVVKKVADKVYAMLLADLRLEAERQRRSALLTHRSIGGR